MPSHDEKSIVENLSIRVAIRVFSPGGCGVRGWGGGGGGGVSGFTVVGAAVFSLRHRSNSGGSILNSSGKDKLTGL